VKRCWLTQEEACFPKPRGFLLPNINSATRATGYRQAMEYLLHCRQSGGQSTPQEFIQFLAKFQPTSRNFAKRQITWSGSATTRCIVGSMPRSPWTQSFSLCARVVPESLEMKRESCILTSRDLQNLPLTKQGWIGSGEHSRDEVHLVLLSYHVFFLSITKLSCFWVLLTSDQRNFFGGSMHAPVAQKFSLFWVILQILYQRAMMEWNGS
jgi:hypothetical protein